MTISAIGRKRPPLVEWDATLRNFPPLVAGPMLSRDAQRSMSSGQSAQFGQGGHVIWLPSPDSRFSSGDLLREALKPIPSATSRGNSLYPSVAAKEETSFQHQAAANPSRFTYSLIT